MSVLYDDVQMHQETAKNTLISFKIYAVTIKISMTQYYHSVADPGGGGGRPINFLDRLCFLSVA